MKVVACPHCGNQRIVTARVPRDVVVVLPCPSCHELVVLFHQKAIALNREIIENGSFEQRKTHIAEIIAEFLEPDMFRTGLNPFGDQDPFPLGSPFLGEPHDDPPMGPEHEPDFGPMPDAFDGDEAPISQQEVEHFVRFELSRLDDPVYFRRHFG